MVPLSVLVALLAVVLLAPTASDLLSLLRVALGAGRPIAQPGAGAERLLFLVPAHNEELSLATCLASLRRLRYPADLTDILVIADNCSDRTADIARAEGVRCLVRNAPTAPGKPHALAWALTRVTLRDYDGVVIVDADTEVDPDFAAHLASVGPLAHRALQPHNGVLNGADNALTRMAAVLAAADHDLAYAWKTRAGLGVPLSAGMCIGSAVLAERGWTAYSVCEDWELYAQLTERGIPMQGVWRARIYAQEAASLRVSATQRRRWTAGKLAVLATQAGPLLRSPRIGFARKLDALSELSRPGPVVHLCLVALATAALALLHPPAARWLAVALVGTLIRPAVYTIAAITRDPQPGRAIAAFAFLPIYAAWRAWSLITTVATLNDTTWVRTGRPARGPPTTLSAPPKSSAPR
jgi:1,2-diacylglycerol 3-beta-glucosyltransferase